MIWFGALGAVDDWLKLTSDIRQRSRRRPQSPGKNSSFRLAAPSLSRHFYIPRLRQYRRRQDCSGFLFINTACPAAAGFYVIAIFYISATSNAVNLTDGMDGLAAGCLGIVSIVLALLCYVASETMTQTGSVTWASYLLLPHISARRRTEHLLLRYSRCGSGLFVVQLPPCPDLYGRCWLTAAWGRYGLWRPCYQKRNPAFNYRRGFCYRTCQCGFSGRLISNTPAANASFAVPLFIIIFILSAGVSPGCGAVLASGGRFCRRRHRNPETALNSAFIR